LPDIRLVVEKLGSKKITKIKKFLFLKERESGIIKEGLK